MTQEEKQILLKDLCGRVPYGVIYHRNDGANIELREVDIKNGTLNYTDNIVVRDCKPYLRSMSSMTEEEKYTYRHMLGATLNSEGESIMFVYVEDFHTVIDWLLSKHFDYCVLIDKGLALEAPEDMYKTKLN